MQEGINIYVYKKKKKKKKKRRKKKKKKEIHMSRRRDSHLQERIDTYKKGLTHVRRD